MTHYFEATLIKLKTPEVPLTGTRLRPASTVEVALKSLKFKAPDKRPSLWWIGASPRFKGAAASPGHRRSITMTAQSAEDLATELEQQRIHVSAPFPSPF